MLLPSLLLADTFIILWLNTSASTADKIKVRDGLYTLLNDRSKIDVTGLPKYRVVANTNTVGWVLVINLENPRQLKANMNNLTLAKLNTWKQNNLTTPAHLQWIIGDEWKQELIDAGLEIAPQGDK